MSTAFVAVFSIAISNFNHNIFYQSRGDGDAYTLSLNSSNSVNSDGEHTITTPTGASVRFQYASVSAPSANYHTTISTGGTIVNKDIIHSITSFTATFAGELQARIAYTTSTWGDYFDLVSGQKLSLGSHPYYLEMKAKTAVSLQSAVYGYSCVVNQDAEEYSTEGEYAITFSTVSADGSTELTSNAILSNTATGSEYVSSYSGISKVYSGINGLKLGSKSNSGSFTVNFKSSIVTEKITSIDVFGYKYGTDSNSINIEVGSESTSFTPTDSGIKGTLSLSTSKVITTLTISTSAKRAYISGITLHYGSSHQPGVPTKDEVGFTATDANKDKYTTNSIYDNDNGLNVAALFSDNSTTTLSKGAEGYSYVVKDSLEQTVNTAEKFPAEGVYTATISYKNYIPVEIQFIVGEYIYVEDIAASMTQATFTTADKLSDHLSGNLSAVLTFSNGDTDTYQYNSFADNNVGVKLLTPKGITYSQTTPFGTEGKWTVRVYRLDDENIKGDFKITVNAIPVQTITLSESSYTLYPEGTLQLTTTINPSTATNQVINWESNNESVATVDENGLVTAIAVGGATITANAADGSGVYAQCSITIVAKPADPYVITFQENEDDLTAALTNLSGLQAQISTGSEYISSASNMDKVFGGKHGIKFGNSSNGGSLTLGLNSSKVTDSISSIEITTKQYSSVTTTLTISVNGGTGVTMSENETKTINVDGNVTSLAFSSAARLYLYNIKLNRGSSTPATPVYPTSISLTGNNSISIGETSQLSVSYTPNDTNVMNATFSSSNTAVATVSADGLVTGISQGNATITATAYNESNQAITSTLNITVSPISVSSISLDQTSLSIKAGRKVTLSPTILPANATNKTITWSTSNSSVATVANGVVTAIAAGSATITVTTQDGNKTATCAVTVTAGGVASAWELVTSASSLAAGDVLVIANSTHGVTAGDISSQIMGTVTSTFSSDGTSIEELGEDTIQLTLGGSEGAWTLANDSGNLLGATAVKKLAWDSGTTTWENSISGGDATIQSTTSSYGRFLCNTSTPRFTTYTSDTNSSMLLPQLYRGGTAEPIDPTSIIMSKSTIELAPGGTSNLSVSYVPNNANQNKDLTWTSSNTSVATVDGTGKVTVKSTATAGQYATITAKLTNFPTITATCRVDVVEQTLDDHTVMIYMCGADLESGTDENGNVPTAANASGLASGDIDEILKVSGQPDDVNIIIETGGANIWESGHSFSISSSKLERWHVEGKKLVKDETLSTYTSMGLTSTFQSFLEWGLTNYPAQRTGVVLWNHGGGMHGVCYDEKKNDDSLLNDEVKTAVGNAFTSTGRSTSNKLEWIGYDACLMSVQDIAEFNSQYFNYQVSSEESEAGYGWDYDNWVDNLYNKQATTSILQEICTTFISDNGGVNKTNGDQTLSYLDLAYMSAYKTAWENMATQLKTKLTSSNKSSFNTAIVNNVKHYADSDYDYFCLFDAKDFINKLASNSAFSSFRIDSSYTNAVITAHGNLVKYNCVQKGAGESYGICMYWPNSTSYSYITTYYTTTQTNFTVWQSICSTYGTHR